jgi:hypothetical protein
MPAHQRDKAVLGLIALGVPEAPATSCRAEAKWPQAHSCQDRARQSPLLVRKVITRRCWREVGPSIAVALAISLELVAANDALAYRTVT